MVEAVLKDDDRYSVHAPVPVGDTSTLLNRMRSTAGQDAAVLVGFDFPMGLPARYAELAGIEDFLSLVPRLGEQEWSDFYKVAERSDQINVYRPFYPQRPGGTAMRHLLDALGVQTGDELLRRCDRGYPGRPAAAPLFWTMGAKQVGKAAIAGWRDLLAPALRSRDLHLAVWPFEGELHELLRSERTVIVETYPAEFYRHLGIKLGSKRNQDDRRNNAATLLGWADEVAVDLSPEMRATIREGFGPSSDGEDPFDATIGLFGMLNVVFGRRPPGEPMDTITRKIEGWMLGQLQTATEREANDTRFQVEEVAAVPAVESSPEYDPLADLYDLEYDHDYDLPFWLALAEREAGPVVEWGAGTGRIAVPLAAAGHDVTA
ncbi:MAG: hypothetical protein ACRDTR_13425, partial [Rubrobacter sp.]